MELDITYVQARWKIVTKDQKFTLYVPANVKRKSVIKSLQKILQNLFWQPLPQAIHGQIRYVYRKTYTLVFPKDSSNVLRTFVNIINAVPLDIIPE